MRDAFPCAPAARAVSLAAGARALGPILLLAAAMAGPLANSALAQECPAPGTVLFPGATGAALLDSLVANFKPVNVLSYNAARDLMYTELDNEAGTVTAIYTGYEVFIDPNSLTPRQDAINVEINAEHSWPQSKGASASPARSDLHHLYPAYSNANSARGNLPFDEIPDGETDTWYRLTLSTSTPDPGLLDEYSERDGDNPHPSYDARWEPREIVEGNIARSMFYFYTMYEAEAQLADPDFFAAQRDALRSWHLADAADADEYDRSCAIAAVQDGLINPFIVDPTLVERAYFGAPAPTVVRFATDAGRVAEEDPFISIEVDILDPSPVEDTVVEVALVGGSATNGDDVQLYSTQTLTFVAGSGQSQVVNVFPVDDGQAEGDEDLVFQLQNVSGGDGAALGAPTEYTLLIEDSSPAFPAAAWINEIHYDNSGADQNEFVEIVLSQDLQNLSLVTLHLYNGSNGGVYDTLTGTNDLIQGDTIGGFTLYYAWAPGLQNGSPDGLALTFDGVVVQFLSYEGSITATGGPASAQTSTDILVEESGSTSASTSLSLLGTGARYDDFSWSAGAQATPGSANEGQNIDGVPLLFSGLRARARPDGVLLSWGLGAPWTGRFTVLRSRGGEPAMVVGSVGEASSEWGEGTAMESWLDYVDAEVEPGTRYDYWIEATEPGGEALRFGPVSVSTAPVAMPFLSLGPNPSRGDVSIRYRAGAGSSVGLRVFDARGRLVRQLHVPSSGSGAAGERLITWDGRDESGRSVSSGVYYVRLLSSAGERSRRVVLIR